MNEYVVSINGNKNIIKVIDEKKIIFNEKKYNYELIHTAEKTYFLRLGNKLFEISGEKINSEIFSVNVGSENFEVDVRTSLQEKARKLLEKKKSIHHLTKVNAPMPGMILKIVRLAGENVEAGDPVIILEAMKMENEVRSPVKGKISELMVNEGTAVEKGMSLFVIE